MAFFDLDFSIRKKSYLMQSDFGDFRVAFFDLAFSIATSYRNGGDFRSEKWRSKNTARLDTMACARPINKNQEKISEIRNTHTRAQRFRPQKKYTRVFEGMIVDSGLVNTAFDMHSSGHHRRLLYNIVASSSSCCSLGSFLISCTHVQPATTAIF